MNDYDIVIVGSGIVGLTAALSIAKKSSLKIAVLETKTISSSWDKENIDYRVSAISAASKKIFKQLNVWNSIVEKRISPYTQMHVWDAMTNSEIHFDCKDVSEQTLGFIVEDSVMRASLLEALDKCGNVDVLFPYTLVSLHETAGFFELSVKNPPSPLFSKGGEGGFFSVKTKLVIAADGANSRVRELLDIPLKTWDYEHTAIVTTLQTELPHQRTAWQRFLETGPLAFLPLNHSNDCSIVWSTSHTHANELMALDDKAFCAVVTEAFDNKLGVINNIGKRYHFPLRMRHAKNYVQSRVALIGDAAHTIHPLAGQGVNLGLLDAVCLAEVITEAVKKKRDFSSITTLRRYERWRKSDNLAMLAGVELLKQLFASKNSSIQQIRNAGIHLTNRTTLIKNFFIRYALGDRGDLPTLAQ